MRSNFRAIVRELGMRYIQPKPKRVKSVIIRRGRRLPNGDMLWMEGGRLYVEKANSDVAQ